MNDPLSERCQQHPFRRDWSCARCDDDEVRRSYMCNEYGVRR